MNLDVIHKQYVVPVIREKDEETLYSICMALADGGMKILEVTLMSENALKVIKRLSQNKDLYIGAGTVLNLEHAEKSLEAGAKFLVSPGLDEETVVYATGNNTLIIPGVMTPTEIMKAKNLGLDLVKIFPVSSLGGLSYLKNLSGPFPDMKWLASGGIVPQDVQHYHQANIFSVGLGSQLTPKEKIQSKNWKGISATARDVVSGFRQ